MNLNLDKLIKTSVVIMGLVMLSPTVLSATIIYGDFVGDTVMYLDVTESNATDEQKFGAPNIFGDQLDFNPMNFRAQSDGAAVIEDSQLNMTDSAPRQSADKTDEWRIRTRFRSHRGVSGQSSPGHLPQREHSRIVNDDRSRPGSPIVAVAGVEEVRGEEFGAVAVREA